MADVRRRQSRRDHHAERRKIPYDVRLQHGANRGGDIASVLRARALPLAKGGVCHHVASGQGTSARGNTSRSTSPNSSAAWAVTASTRSARAPGTRNDPRLPRARVAAAEGRGSGVEPGRGRAGRAARDRAGRGRAADLARARAAVRASAQPGAARARAPLERARARDRGRAARAQPAGGKRPRHRRARAASRAQVPRVDRAPPALLRALLLPEPPRARRFADLASWQRATRKK